MVTKKSRKPFKQTKELVRLALHSGWTQKEIADKCRTQQSVVSSWNKGTKKGTEQQLAPLLEIFGHKLRRNTYEMYWAIEGETRKFFKVEGKVIFSHCFYEIRKGNCNKFEKIPKLKLIVHQQGKNTFRLITQYRLSIKNLHKVIEKNLDDVLWESAINEQLFDKKQLVSYFDSKTTELSNDFLDARLLPFLIRQALVNHGVELDDVIDFPMEW